MSPVVSERLRQLSPPLRYLVYVAGALLIFLVALGVGAVAAVVVGWPLEWAAGGPSSGSSAPEATTMGTTGPSGSAGPVRPARGASSFVHRATDENSRRDYTFISDPRIDGDANAVVLVALAPARQNAETTAPPYGHNVGVWYEPTSGRWAIFNEDRAPIPAGAAFRVSIPPASEGFVHRAAPSDTVGNATYLYGPLTNGKPDASVSVTQNWNPGGGEGVYNDHPVGVFYDGDVGQWAIYNEDGASMPDGAAFNVAVSGGTAKSSR